MQPLHIAFFVIAGIFLILLILYPFVKRADKRKKKNALLTSLATPAINQEKLFAVENHLRSTYPKLLTLWKDDAVRVLDNKYLTSASTLPNKELDIFDDLAIRYFDDGSISVILEGDFKSGMNYDKLKIFIDEIANYQSTPKFEKFSQNDLHHIQQKDWLGRLLLSSDKTKPMPDIIIGMNDGRFELSLLGLRI